MPSIRTQTHHAKEAQKFLVPDETSVPDFSTLSSIRFCTACEKPCALPCKRRNESYILLRFSPLIIKTRTNKLYNARQNRASSLHEVQDYRVEGIDMQLWSSSFVLRQRRFGRAFTTPRQGGSMYTFPFGISRIVRLGGMLQQDMQIGSQQRKMKTMRRE